MLSPEGIVSSWNVGAEKIKGYSSEEIIGHHFSRFYTDEDQDLQIPAKALETARTEGKFEADGWRVRKDGSRFWASVVIDAIHDSEGHLIGFAKITRDVTERKKAAEAIRASEEQFRLLVQGVTDYAIYLLSPEGIVTSWNAGAMRIKGYSDSEIIGSHFSTFYTEEDRERGLPARAIGMATKTGRFENEGWRVRKDGSTFWAHVIIDAIYNDLGEIAGFAKVTRDVTERRRAATELEAAQTALFQAQKMESIGQITGGVAHDFNNLLNVISNGLMILQKKSHDEFDSKIIKSMERSVEKGVNLIQQLLTFSRQQPVDLKPYNLNTVIRSFEEILHQAIPTSNIRFSLNLSNTLPRAVIDTNSFESAILNLVVNSRDAIEDGGEICLHTETVELDAEKVANLPAGNYVKVTVSDTGHGIPKHIVEKVIEPFFTTKPIGKGTGLGLSQVYGFVQQCKGGMEINSIPDKSTFISLYFPSYKELSKTSSGEPEVSHAEKALVVDDQPDVLEIAVQLFEMLGYEVISARSGEEALKLITTNSDINVLFSDVVMPGMDGVELAKRAQLILPRLKILLASGYPGPTLRAEHQSLQSFPFISKPYKLPEIAKILRVA
jgi:PAS domain S-box-containing protein